MRARPAKPPRSPTRSSRRCRARRCSSASRRATVRKTRRSASTSTSRGITRCKAFSCSTPEAPGPHELSDAEPRMAAGTLKGRDAFLPLIGGLIALAWLTLYVWEQSPYGRYLDHGQWLDIGLAAYLCQTLPAGPMVLPALLYVGGWVLMIAAMMLPTSL